MSPRRFVVALAALLLAAGPATALAHTGPPFVVVSERQVGPYTTTVWADPDVGAGTFIVEAASSDAPLPEGSSVTVSARPSGAAASEVSGAAERQQTNGGRVFIATLPLASEGAWEAQVVLDGPAGRGEATFQLQVTPAIEGWVTTLICTLPFIGLGIAWLVGLWLQRRRQGPELEARG
ncbi:MAG TPA: hypothetical protein VFS21_34100 [Roseiflexaceae bacterium]|nr:hypothetical protein [Roseiflexaceae bacterium]